MRQHLCLILVGFIVLGLIASPIYAEPGRGKGLGRGNHEPRGMARGLYKDRERDRDFIDRRQDLERIDRHVERESLERARWFHNPNDERGQGNMGKVDMIAPYGHDKDSDRKELYGNRGRVVREPEPEPEPDPEPEPEPEPWPPIPPPSPYFIQVKK